MRVGVNRWIGLGELLEDSRFQYIYYGTGACRFTLMVDMSYTDSRGRETKSFFLQPVYIWGKLGEKLAPRLKAGTQVYVEGPLKKNRYDGGPEILECSAERIWITGEKKGRSQDVLPPQAKPDRLPGT